MTAALIYGSLPAQNVPTKNIVPYVISVGYNKTSNLIFPYAIQSVDRGSADVLVQKAKGIDNILQLKAAEKDFEETNLTVITADGRFYSFLVDYNPDPEMLNLSFEGKGSNALFKGRAANEAAYRAVAGLIQKKKAFLHTHHKEQKMKIRLQSLYLKDGLMYFDLQLKNKSLVDYLPETPRFFICDRKQARRTAAQQVELQPTYSDKLACIEGGKTGQIILAFKSFTLLPSQKLAIQIGEPGGGRTLSLKISHRILLKARKLVSTL